MKYDIWYSRPTWFGKGIMGIKPDPDHLGNTHAFIKIVEAKGPDDVFFAMQGENWSPNGEARTLIEESGASHTSMSVGDVMVNHNNGQAWMVDYIGFADLGYIK